MFTGSLVSNLQLHLGNEHSFPHVTANCLPSRRVCTSDLGSVSLVFFFWCLTALFCD